jgi:6-pyruvoyltetrahydropterin/6-carboxytetrahydropterin synthase
MKSMGWYKMVTIRKLFKFEAAHIVKDAYSERCRFSIHGHSYKVEVFVSSDKLKNGMVIDFGQLKPLKEFVDKFDHALMIDRDNYEKLKDGLKNFPFQRLIIFPVPVTAENLAIFFLSELQERLDRLLEWLGDDRKLVVSKVVVHETETGCAEATQEDVKGVDWIGEVVIDVQ